MIYKHRLASAPSLGPQEAGQDGRGTRPRERSCGQGRGRQGPAPSGAVSRQRNREPGPHALLPSWAGEASASTVQTSPLPAGVRGAPCSSTGAGGEERACPPSPHTRGRSLHLGLALHGGPPTSYVTSENSLFQREAGRVHAPTESTLERPSWWPSAPHAKDTGRGGGGTSRRGAALAAERGLRAAGHGPCRRGAHARGLTGGRLWFRTQSKAQLGGRSCPGPRPAPPAPAGSRAPGVQGRVEATRGS